MAYAAIGTAQDRRTRCCGTSSESSVTMTSQVCHWLAAFVAVAVLPDALLLLFLVLVPVVTGRSHKNALFDPTLHAKSMHHTAESSLYLHRLHAVPHTGNPLSSPWLALLVTTRFSLSMISQMGSFDNHHVSTFARCNPPRIRISYSVRAKPGMNTSTGKIGN
ncbi:hypothetical protein M422DRAFT_270373 [Sphaerobolus stellatus SS14]|uniref:Uncharacterized protein n=1 Tax=Sphaerobolus stellatus (strain SS14) TaxID=990650 RepID=A0A0C9UHG9_SPHS4|nr:hypothetical protein M422DRAFT_270373 [Sphaerobolus stellatus SS14]